MEEMTSAVKNLYMLYLQPASTRFNISNEDELTQALEDSLYKSYYKYKI